MRRPRYLLAGLALLAFGVALGATAEVLRPYETLRLGKYTFHIPKENAMTNGVPVWLRWMPGLDDGSRSALFMIEASTLGGEIPGYRQRDGLYEDDIEGLLMVLTPEEVGRYRDSSRYYVLVDLWYRQGSYRERKVEPYGSSGWYKVYRRVEYPRSWVLLTAYPDPAKPLPENQRDLWVASCLELNRPAGQTGKGVSCRGKILFDDIVVEFHISDYNLPVIDQVRDFLKARVLEWKQPAD